MLSKEKLCLLRESMHLVKNDGTYYVFATRANRLFELTTNEANTLKKCVLGDAVSTDTASFSIDKNTDFLEQLYSHCVIDQPHSPEPRLSSLVLLVSEACNFSCTYCYGTYGEKTQKMGKATAFNAIDLALELGIRDIVFFGGEPLTNFSLIREAVSYIESFKLKDITLRLTTNGSLITEDIAAYLQRHKFQVSVSMDGDKESQDLTRLYHNKDSTYQDVIRGIEILKKHNVLTLIEITYSARHKDLKKQVDSALEIFPVVSCSCVDGQPDSQHDDDVVFGDRLQQYYHALLDIGNTIHDDEQLIGAKELYNKICNGAPFVQPKYLCSDIGTRLIVSPSGNVVPCPEMTERDKYVICNIASISSAQAFLEQRARVLDQLLSTKIEQKWFSGLCETCIQHVKENKDHFEYIDANSFEDCIESLLIRYLRDNHAQ